MKKFYKNKCKCKICGKILESVHVHDYVDCEHCFTDGGLAYTRRGWSPEYGTIDDVIENIVEEIIEEEYNKYNIRRNSNGIYTLYGR